MAVQQIEREVQVLAVFRQILGAPELGPEQNFFEAGGSSLLAARLATRLRTAGVLDIPASAIFAAPTARLLTRYAQAPTVPRAAVAPFETYRDQPALSAPNRSAIDRGARQRAAFARLRPASPANMEEDQ